MAMAVAVAMALVMAMTVAMALALALALVTVMTLAMATAMALALALAMAVALAMIDKEAIEAFKRICDNAMYGIESNDHELMNPENYKKELDEHVADRETVEEALTTEQAVDVEELKQPVDIGLKADYSKGLLQGWNDCLNHLVEQGIFRGRCINKPKARDADNGKLLIGEDE
jgi:ABC-type multidrug transport system fused ATPase/permease subunit